MHQDEHPWLALQAIPLLVMLVPVPHRETLHPPPGPHLSHRRLPARHSLQLSAFWLLFVSQALTFAGSFAFSLCPSVPQLVRRMYHIVHLFRNITASISTRH